MARLAVATRKLEGLTGMLDASAALEDSLRSARRLGSAAVAASVASPVGDGPDRGADTIDPGARTARLPRGPAGRATTALTVETLAVEPRWDRARLAALPGRCRGDLLGRWGENVARRFGAGALARVRCHLAPPLDRVAPVLGEGDWVPSHIQVAVTEAIIDVLLDGDAAALGPLLLEDTRAGLGWTGRALLRALGPGRALEHAPRAFEGVHDRGRLEVAVAPGRALLRFRGHPLFANPTWRMLQLMAQRAVLELTGSSGDAVGEELGTDGFVVLARW